MRTVRLRPVQAADLAALTRARAEAPLTFFGFEPVNKLERRFAATGLIGEDDGLLAVESERGALLGEVGWHAVQHGPAPSARALNLGISLLVEHRGQGYGTAAQAALADYLFATRTVERLEAGTDLEHVAEQRALAAAGFVREGVLRHAQFRAGGWHDVVLFSRLRGDPGPGAVAPAP